MQGPGLLEPRAGKGGGQKHSSTRCLSCSCSSSSSSRRREAARRRGASISKGSLRGDSIMPLESTPQQSAPQPCFQNIVWHEGACTRSQKEALLGQKGCLLWFTGLSGSGKSTVACTVEHALVKRGVLTTLLDGDNIRHGLNCNLGFSAEDRAENIRRVGEVSKLFVESGIITLASFISPYAADRELVRSRMNPGDFVEVYMKVPLEICEQRDPKGLYKLARAGKIKGFTGIDDPYEAPAAPELTLNARDSNGALHSPEAMAASVIKYLEEVGYIRKLAPAPAPIPQANNAVATPSLWQDRALVGAGRGSPKYSSSWQPTYDCGL